MKENIECFYNLVKDGGFRDEFREYVKELYKAGRHREYGLPAQYASFVRQLNRIRWHSEGGAKQSRSGRKAWGSWEELIKKFMDDSFFNSARHCLSVLGIGQDKGVGMFTGELLSWNEWEDLKRYYGDMIDIRGPFSSWDDLKGYAGMLGASAPVFYGIVCGQWVMIAGSQPPELR